MKVEAKARDAAPFCVDYLTDVMSDEDCTVGIDVPAGWTPSSTPHLQVVSDGTPRAAWPIATYSTVRLTARAGSRSEAIRLCAVGQGWLLAHNGDDGIASTSFLTGPLDGRDPQTNAEIASSTTRVTVRTEPIPVGS